MTSPPTTHFRPPNGWVGDVIPFEVNGTAWLFYLLDERPTAAPLDRSSGMPWAAVTTTDFVEFEDRGIVLPSGGPSASDFDCYTGSVVRDDAELLHLFYTGHNPRVTVAQDRGAGDAQVVCHATSDGDPSQWRKHPEWDLPALDGYSAEDWRDPFVFRPDADGPWQMLLATRRSEGPYRRSGIVARLESDDLIAWRDAAPLWEPHRFITQECPDVFQWGNWWYLVYSEFSDAFCTRYRVGTSADGPWSAPEDDTIDGRAFYAAKTVQLGEERYFVGWIASKQDDCDDAPWQWAGTMATLQAHQRPDGSLGFDLPETVKAAYRRPTTVTDEFTPLNAASETVGAGAQHRYAAWVGPRLPTEAIVAIDLDIAEGTQSCGVLLRASEDGEQAYALRLEPQRHRLVLDRWPRGRTGGEQWQIRGDVPHAVELERPVHLPPGRHRLEIHLDGDLCVAVVDGDVALSARLYDRPEGRLGLFAQDGGFDLISAEIRERTR
jgi:beta-fructofuranosidase